VQIPDDRDPTRWRVFADWLVDCGNPHGDRLNRMLHSAEPLVGIEDLPRPVRAIEALTWRGLHGPGVPARFLALAHTRVTDEVELEAAVDAGARSLELPDTLLPAVAEQPVTDLWPVDIQTFHTPEMLVPLPHVRRMAVRLAEGLGHDTLRHVLEAAGRLEEAHLHVRNLDPEAIVSTHRTLQRLTWRTGSVPSEFSGPRPAVGRDFRPIAGPTWWPGDRTPHGVVLERVRGSADGPVYRLWEPERGAIRFVTRRRDVVFASDPGAEPVVEGRTEQVHWAARSVQGFDALGNQDCWVASGRRFAVLDGVHGIRGSEAAVVRDALEAAPSIWDALEAVDEVFRVADPPIYAGVAALELDETAGEATVAWSGSVRVGHLRDGRFRWITRDHTLAEVHPEGQIPDHYGHVLVQMLGSGDEPTDHLSVDLRPGDRLVVCTNGIWQALDDGVVQGWMCSESDPAECVRRLVADARRCGDARTDITAVVLDVQ
jgi:protein phosphatase